MNNFTDELFSLRLSLQDTIFDESIIIRELKMFLINKQVPQNEINDILINFYKNYGINFSEEFISSVEIPQLNINSANVLASFIINPQSFINNQSQLNVINEENGEDYSESDNESEYSSETESLPGDELGSNLEEHDNVLFTLPQNNTLSSHQLENPLELFNALNNLMNLINIDPPEMEDVKSTLDDKDIDKIKDVVANEDLEQKCSISMLPIKKGDTYSELPCGHIFHKDCIMKWLKEYNYKCPVCRKECGKPKYDI